MSAAALFLLASFLCGSAAHGQAAAPIAVTAFPASTAVGQQSTMLSVVVSITQSGTSAAPLVLTQGIGKLDFQIAPGGTCASDVPYTIGQQCTVNVIFAPKYPGLRSGAVVVEGSGGSGTIVLGQTLLTGTATGGLPVLTPGDLNTVAGNTSWTYAGDGILATSASIFLPMGVVADAAGNLYISDTNNDRIRRVDVGTGLISTVAGTGTPGYTGDGALATQAEINAPAGIAMDGAGNLYFADADNDAIRRIDAVTGNISTVAGMGGVQGYSGDSGLATAAKLSLPEGLAFDAAQDLYIADTGNNRVREVSAATGDISTIAGTGAAAYGGDQGYAVSAQLNSPWGVAIGGDGSVYIADLNNNAVRKVTPAGIISTVAGDGSSGFTGDGGAAAAAQLEGPTSVVFDPAGNMYIADAGNNRVREVYAGSNNIQTIAGTGTEGLSTPELTYLPVLASSASFYGPYALYLDQTGDLLVADTFHMRIREIYADALALSYATMRVGKVSAPQIEGLANDGNASLTVAAPTLSQSALDPATTTCNTGTIVPSAGTCNLGVDFAPTSVSDPTTQPIDGTLTVNSDAGPPAPLISLSGLVLSVNPTTVSTPTSSANPSLVGAAVTFTATASNGGSGSLSGTMVFYDGSTQICSVAVASNGSATCTPNPSLFTLGLNSITASYSGDAEDASSVSQALSQDVQQATTLALVVTPNPAVITGTVTLTASLSVPSGTPTGTVTFYDGSTSIGSVTLTGGNVPSFSTSQLSAATHNLSAQYSDDTNDAAATSNTVSEVVNLATTTTTSSSSNLTVTVGTAVTLSATVTSTNGPVPTETVQFASGATPLGTGTLAASGSGSAASTSVALPALAPGTYSIVATYSGDNDNATSAATALTETIQQIPTTTTLVSDMNLASAGATVHLTATVAMASGNTADGAITGTVTFTDGSTTLGTAPLSASGQATLAVSTLAVGTHSIVASYGSNTNYAASSSNTLSEQIQSTATTTVISAPSSGSLAGEPITLTITVSSATGVPTGSVSIHDGSATLGQAPLNAQGTATFTTTSLAVGGDTISAVYGGDANYLTSTSNSVQETVSLATTALTLAGPTAAVDAGTTVTLAATLTSNGVAPTGALTLHDGSATIATQTVAGTGSFTFSTAGLALGANTLMAVYAGDSNNAAAVSAAITVTVQPGPTTTSLATSANPSTLGQSLTLSASVTSPSPGITGSITFEDGSTVLASEPLVNGAASYTTSSLAFGTHSLTAVYSSDTDHAASTSNTVPEQIVEPASASLMSSVNPSASGVNVIFTAQIAGVGGIVPTGSVIFSDGATTLGTVPLNATGGASFQSAVLVVGSHAISVSYGGDSHYSGASASLIQTVQDASTQIAIAASANPAIYATPLSLTATITSNGSAATGTVTFTDGGAAIGTAVLNGSGVATLTLSSLAPGAHSIVANYAGDSRAGASVSTPLALVVKQLTSVALGSSANPSPTLSLVTFTATITNSGVGEPTGTVTFTDGGTQLGTATVVNGQATLTVPELSAANHSIVASYSGDGSDFAGVSSTLTEGVQLRPTTTVLTASQTNASNPLQVTLIGVVRWTGPATPTGSITFTSGGNTIGSSPVDSTGVATITIDLQSATENITAAYSGDTAYAASSSLSTTISGGVATQFTLAVSPSSVSVQSQQHITVTVTATSLSGFTDTLQLGCLGLPFAATCTFTNPQVTTANSQMSLAANGTSTMQLVIDTGDPLGAGAQANNRGASPTSVALCFFPGTLLAGLLFFRKRRRALLPLLLLLCAVTASFGITGCGGLQINGTPPGTYTFKVTASGTQTGVTVTQDVTLTVTQ